MEAVNMIITSLKGDVIIIVNRFHIESAEQILSRGEVPCRDDTGIGENRTMRRKWPRGMTVLAKK